MSTTLISQDLLGSGYRRLLAAAETARKLGAQACAGDPAADDQDVKVAHVPPGYELESRAV